MHETTYQLLAELAHIFMEDPRRLGDRCVRCGDLAFSARVLELSNGVATIERDGFIEEISVDMVEPEVAIGDVLLCHAGAALPKSRDRPTAGGAHLGIRTGLSSFLYFEVTDLDAGLVAACASTVSKRAELPSPVRTTDLAGIERCADAMRHRLDRGGRLITLGDGGSSAAARDAAADFLARRWSAVAVITDRFTVRLGDPNVVLVEDSFVDRLRPLARSDVVLAISTNRSTSDMLAGLHEAHRRGALTCAITDEPGGPESELDWLDHRLMVPGELVLRVPEARTTICHLLLEMVGRQCD
ncbi:MAG: SIS domain-containing protein [Actinomycetota bacterium]|nr:SIS domain-containing protein [Actinomycetota bacterium]